MTALEQMKKALESDPAINCATVNVRLIDLRVFVKEVEHLRAKVTELQVAGSRLALERQGIDKDRFAIAEKVRAACVAAAETTGAKRAVQDLDLAKVLGP